MKCKSQCSDGLLLLEVVGLKFKFGYCVTSDSFKMNFLPCFYMGKSANWQGDARGGAKQGLSISVYGDLSLEKTLLVNNQTDIKEMHFIRKNNRNH